MAEYLKKLEQPRIYDKRCSSRRTSTPADHSSQNVPSTYEGGDTSMNQDVAEKSDKTFRDSAVKIAPTVSKSELASPSMKTTHRENAATVTAAPVPVNKSFNYMNDI